MAPETDALAPAVSAKPSLVRAAGCVLWMPAPGGAGPLLALVHRPRYGDWSHPKGKLHPGESPAAAAVREVLEETGARCELGAQLPTARYLADGRPKEVSYWVAESLGGRFVPNDEVDAVRWLPPGPARDLLSADIDRSVLAAALAALPERARW